MGDPYLEFFKWVCAVPKHESVMKRALTSDQDSNVDTRSREPRNPRTVHLYTSTK